MTNLDIGALGVAFYQDTTLQATVLAWLALGISGIWLYLRSKSYTRRLAALLLVLFSLTIVGVLHRLTGAVFPTITPALDLSDPVAKFWIITYSIYMIIVLSSLIRVSFIGWAAGVIFFLNFCLHASDDLIRAIGFAGAVLSTYRCIQIHTAARQRKRR
jgi:hypothetical protein